MNTNKENKGEINNDEKLENSLNNNMMIKVKKNELSTKLVENEEKNNEQIVTLEEFVEMLFNKNRIFKSSDENDGTEHTWSNADGKY